MSKLLRITIVSFIICMLLIPVFVQATTVNMNLTADTAVENTVSDNSDATEPQATGEDLETTLSPSSTNYSTNSPTVSTLNQLPEASLGLSNIINIILIVIGVLLILLGIAIIIRLKH